MDRRLVGILLIVAGIVVATAIAVTRPPDLRASRAAGPEPPAVGDCFDPVVTADPGGAGRPAPADRTFGPCRGEHLGEIVAVRLHPSPDAKLEMDNAGCQSDLMRHAGLQADGDRFVLSGDDPDDPVAWTYSLNAQTIWIWQWPNLPPEANGWAACMVIARVRGADEGAIADAYNGGSLPPSLGTCWSPGGSAVSMMLTDCTVAHTAEEISSGVVRAPAVTTLAAAKDSCARQAAEAIGRADPTIGGEFTVSLTVTGSEHAEFTLKRAVDCVLITADGRRILGSLIGLHDQPVRFTG